jgi:tetratricopeptide (TPR) repeat protein
MTPKTPRKVNTDSGAEDHLDSVVRNLLAASGLEQKMTEFTRMIENQEFESAEEADRYLERLLRGDEALAPDDDSPQGQAQSLISDAWDFLGAYPRVDLAREALTLWPDCADAYCILAESAAHTLRETQSLYEQAVEAGTRAMGGDEAFTQWVGQFWMVLPTRPYMRARAGLADALWMLGECDAAIAHLQDMLRLCPNDNMGLRYMLINWLLAAGRDADAGKLLDHYKRDAAATWAYSRALLAFRQKGAGRPANARLRAAEKVNEYVPDLMLGYAELPPILSPHIGLSEETEAAAYVSDSVKVWIATEGALEWMEDILFE